jgi:hypothetical protein
MNKTTDIYLSAISLQLSLFNASDNAVISAEHGSFGGPQKLY